MAKRSIVWLLPLALILLIFFLVQFSQPTIIGADGYLHGRLSLMVARSGFLKELPQAHFSWFATRFSDKDFLYHLYLVPFVSLFGLLTGAKLGGFVATGLLAATIVYLLGFYGKNHWASWAGLMLLLSSQFIRDTAEARPFIFAILLTLFGIHSFIQGKAKWVFIVSFFYGMAHLSAWTLPLLAFVFTLHDWVASGKRNATLLGASAGGWLLSFLIHPNFPNNLFYFYLNGILVPWYAAKTGVLELGAEFFPLNTQELLRAFPVLVLGGMVLFWLRLTAQGKLSRETTLWGISIGLFLPLGLIAKRNLTHLYPIAIIFFGLGIVETLREQRRRDQAFFDRALCQACIAGVLFGVYSMWQTVTGLSHSLLSEKIYSEHFSLVAALLNAKAPKGTRIFHSNWSDSQYLIGMAPDYEYFMTLDPIYMYSYNKDLYALYRQVSFGQVNDPYRTLKDTFGVTYGYAGKNYFKALIEQIRRDSRFSIEGEDQLGIVFSLKDR